MTIAYLIDTDWVIHYLNGHPAIVERLEELQEAGLAPSVISLAELYEGIYYSRDPDRNEQALNNRSLSQHKGSTTRIWSGVDNDPKL